MQRRHRRGTFQRECKYVTSAWYWRKGVGGVAARPVQRQKRRDPNFWVSHRKMKA